MSVVHGVLVTYQRPDEVKAYLEALASQTRGVDTLLVVDNDPAESARAIVEGHHGRIEASNSPIGGLRITVILPATPPMA